MRTSRNVVAPARSTARAVRLRRAARLGSPARRQRQLLAASLRAARRRVKSPALDWPSRPKAASWDATSSAKRRRGLVASLRNGVFPGLGSLVSSVNGTAHAKRKKTQHAHRARAPVADTPTSLVHTLRGLPYPHVQHPTAPAMSRTRSIHVLHVLQTHTAAALHTAHVGSCLHADPEDMELEEAAPRSVELIP